MKQQETNKFIVEVEAKDSVNIYHWDECSHTLGKNTEGIHLVFKQVKPFKDCLICYPKESE